MSRHPHPVRKPLFTGGTFVLLGVMALGFSFGLARFFSGLGAVTNLSHHYPWGIWKAINVAVGVALAASGFTSAALIDIFGRKKYHSLLRPAILTAWFGYIMVAVSLLFDVGRYWNIWRPIFNWQGNSVLFEVAMCVMTYLVVLTFEISPAILEGLKYHMQQDNWVAKLLKKLEKPVLLLHSWVKIVLPVFIVAGFVLSCMHHSSLGTLMLIAPGKVSSLWFSPMLPVLFLVSAMMVGFPMVIFESLLASRTFKYKPDMEMLSSLALKVNWIVGVYLALKLSDLVWRWHELNFLVNPGLTVSLAVEVIAGVVAPFLLLWLRSVRRSPGMLLFTMILIISGVVMNRLNTYLVGYVSPYGGPGYFPSFGEISMTLALAAVIVFLYRVFVTFFPILPAYAAEDAEGERDTEDESYNRQLGSPSSWRQWAIRGSGFAVLFSFIVLYAVVHHQALAGTHLTPPRFQVKKFQAQAPETALAFRHQSRPLEYRNLYIMESPLLNSKTDDYEPVRFSHRTHDVLAGGDCSVCHHRISMSEDDRAGESLKEMHASIDVRIGGACSGCHTDLNEKQFQKCSFCHIESNEADRPSRIGLRGAYHRQCIGCHREQPASAKAPYECSSCHHPLTPDHRDLIGPLSVSADNPQSLTARCLSCHPNVGVDIVQTAHWNWKGLSPNIQGREHSAGDSLGRMMDNYEITMHPALTGNYSHHIAYNKHGEPFNPAKAENADCLICHAVPDAYIKDENRNGFPRPDADLSAIARKVGRPTRANCGACHFNMGGGPNYKHGDLEPSLANPNPSNDVHMGMIGMRCQDCHKTNRHQIAGLSFAAPAMEGRVSCESCHGSQPHGISGFLSRHLDDHVNTVACETCHIPSFARETPTLLHTDFSTAGADRTPNTDANGMPDYDKRYGSLTWGKNVIPVYRWFDGARRAYVAGDSISPGEIVDLNKPLGEKHIPESRIYPFKEHTAIQPYDTEKSILTAVQFKNGYWRDFDWSPAIREGQATLGLAFSGKFDFIKTRMVTSIRHGVVPARQALGCADCHSVDAISCRRCHKNARDMEQPEHTRKVYSDATVRMNFKELGYEDDPALIGGRFFRRMGRGAPLK